MKKNTVVALVIALVVIGGALVLAKINPTGDDKLPAGQADNVSVANGQQIIEIGARGGYSPRTTQAKAGLPTTIKVKTKSTFDCSATLVIPSLNYRASLPRSGVTEINLPPQKPGDKLEGLCAMGMYNFTVNFN